MFASRTVAVACATAVMFLAGSSGVRAAPGRSDDYTAIPGAGLVLLSPIRSDPAGENTGAGAQVGAVTPGGPAADAGVAPGDVIIRIGGRPVGTPQDVAAGIRADRESGRSADTLLVMRRGRVYYTVISLKAR
jgi:S1-C subfamily serine protease